MGLFNETPNESILNKSAYCVLYEVMKTYKIETSSELVAVLEGCLTECDRQLSAEERKELKPVYQRAFEIAQKYSLKEVKNFANEVGSDLIK